MGVKYFVAFLWGLAEATLFFLVPDIWLTILARQGLRTALLACAYALGGALLGGMLMYYWGAEDITGLIAVLDGIPAVNQTMIQETAAQMGDTGLTAMLFGPLSGTPYKIYAGFAGHLDYALWLFLLLSVPARLLRFVAVTLLSHYLLRLIQRYFPTANLLLIIVSLWLLFYLFYFSLMAN